MSQLREHLRQAAVTTVWHEASAEQRLKALCLQAADELAAAEARCTALQQQLAECYRLSGADPDGNEDEALAPLAVKEVRRLRAESDGAESELFNLRGSITRLIAQWREKEKDGDEGFDMCADELEAALTRHGEASK